MHLVGNASQVYRPRAVIPLAATLTAAFLIRYCFLRHGDAHPSTRPSDDRAAWRERGARLDTALSVEVDRAWASIREIGERVIVPLLRSVEAEDQGRTLARFDRRFKDPDRLKRKLADQLRRAPGRTPVEGLATIADAVRFTLQYRESGYVAGVRRDMERLVDRGLILVALRNTWTDDQYKGINSRWREPTSGLLFEVQFHTWASLAARELTHVAYERLRGECVKGAEIARLRAFQRYVNAAVPMPPGAVDVRGR